MEIIEILGYAWCIWMPFIVMEYLFRECWRMIKELNELDD